MTQIVAITIILILVTINLIIIRYRGEIEILLYFIAE